MCGKTRDEHPKRRFCPLAPMATPKSSGRGKGKGKGKKQKEEQKKRKGAEEAEKKSE